MLASFACIRFAYEKLETAARRRKPDLKQVINVMISDDT
jgi:hypothetical protein